MLQFGRAPVNACFFILSQFGLYYGINEPAHILEPSSSCIKLIFTSQLNFITESGLHQFYLQIIFD